MSIGIYSLGLLKDFINLLIFLFDPLPNSTMAELLGNIFLNSLFKSPIILILFHHKKILAPNIFAFYLKGLVKLFFYHLGFAC